MERPQRAVAVVRGSRNKGDSGARSGGGTAPGTPRPRTPGSAGGRPFISYLAAHPEEAESDPDGLDQPARMALEAKAIDLILSRESEWRRTRTHNPGFDLYQGDEQSSATRWCEVKAMTGRSRTARWAYPAPSSTTPANTVKPIGCT